MTDQLALTPRPFVLDTPETERRQSGKARILAFLQQHGSATNVELNEIAFRYGGRIHELRREGWIITDERKAGGLWVYRLIGKKAL